MRRILVLLSIVALFGAAYAELQNVEIGGQIRMRGRWWHNGLAPGLEVRIPDGLLPRRPIGPYGTQSLYDWDSRGPDLKFVETRTVLNVKADFTDDVAAFIELESYDRWGEEFRSDWVTGADNRAVTTNDVEVFQAYIEANEMFGQPLRLRIGRQSLKMGKGWLIADLFAGTLGLSFDAIRATYSTDLLDVDAFWGKLAENLNLEEDGDVDIYGVYGTYKGFEPVSLSAYWYMVRDAISRTDTDFPLFLEWLEDLFRLDDYDPSYLHTIGIRAFGGYEAFDYDLELAYQFGEADAVGSLFLAPDFYGDDDADFDAWGADAEVGYSFDYACNPRVYIGGNYYGGEDNRDISFWDWLNPFYRSTASVSFNRLFSIKNYTHVFDTVGGAQATSNFWGVRTGVSGNVTDAIKTGLEVSYFGVVEPFDLPAHVTIGGYRILLAPALSFWTEEGDDEIGWHTHLWTKYTYSEDWAVQVGWQRLFCGDACEDGFFWMRNGLTFGGGTDKDDSDYIYFDTQVKF